ncbi:Trans-resveratrol di-O-methyltransferase [Hibiscus syriacus]|uniref:Trans-resveratrol di-O-methyltransferase n=1 Tax=Hibiscus syriacus TaxID=106335 RepID=A0A6A2YD43_HIBSY|nr:Trans-resveratrol di-O-methyltransferase [Hibiscus syriacus]
MDKVSAKGENVSELLEAQAHVWNHIFSFINSMSLKCAIDLGIPDIIQNHGKPMTITELVAALPKLNPTKACHISRLMRILVHSGFFAKQKLDDYDGYVLTDASRLLLKDNPLNAAPLLKFLLDPILMQPWHFVGAWFQNDDRTPFVTAHGEMLWDYCSHDPRGTGTLGKTIADAYPHLECTVFDLPRVVAGLHDCGNLKFVGGDMFEHVPAADAVLLKGILHDWSDEECVKILKRCKEAISNGGKVIIIDTVVMKNKKANDDGLETQLFIDMEMMAFVTGKERYEEEWANLFSSAGFSGYNIIPILGLRSLIEVYP